MKVYRVTNDETEQVAYFEDLDEALEDAKWQVWSGAPTTVVETDMPKEEFEKSNPNRRTL